MDFADLVTNSLRWLPPKLLAMIEKRLKRVPQVRQQIEAETGRILSSLDETLKPYRDSSHSYSRIPDEGVPREEILAEMASLQAREAARWQEGHVSGAVYHGDAEHIGFLSQVYSLHSQSNPLHADLWPSATKFEAEVVAMTASMLGAAAASADDEPSTACGVVTSGGTESILMAMKAYRDQAFEERGIARPEIVVPATAHAAFDKAGQYFRIKVVRVPVAADYRADVEATRRAISRHTIALAGSAPGFPHGAIDPIEPLSDLARAEGIGFHTDACLGGFLLPWAEKLGYEVPRFDFRLPGVTSISADTHKYGYAAKGTSVVLYRDPALRRCQYFTATEWPGGLYFSPTMAGSRTGALSAVCWAAMTTMGQRGYVEATRRILKTASTIKNGIRRIPELHVLGDPYWVIALGSDSLDIYKVLDQMASRQWNLNGLHKPPAFHLCVTLRQTQPGVADRFLADLKASVDHVREHPDEPGEMAPVYGLAATLPMRGVVGDMLKGYMDKMYEV